MAIAALVMFGRMLWQHWRAAHPGRGVAPVGGRGAGAMTREEAFQVLGLQPGASEADIRAAHRRLMRGRHPDSGGSDWLASRINQARVSVVAGVMGVVRGRRG